MKNLIGEIFNRLLVLKLEGRNKWSQQLWRCRCDCGKESIVTTRNLKTGHTKSCGCLHVERIKEQCKQNITHNMTKTKFYKIWDGIKGRCNNSDNMNYKNYGARGIKCEWVSFEEFRDDMYELYLDHIKNNKERQTSLERIDNNRNYCQGNCKWATYKEQNRNSRNTHQIRYNGETKCISEWAEQYGLNHNILRSRLFRSKWPIEKALLTPIKVTRPAQTIT